MSEWILVSEDLGEESIEIETEEDGRMLLESLTAHFPGTTTLKYKNPENLAFRGIKCIDGILNPPSKDLGWGISKLYYCVNPEKEHAKKRKADVEDPTASKHFKPDPSKSTDLVLLGLAPKTTEQDIRDYFSKHGEVTMVHVKKSKDDNVGYGFIRFKDKEVEREMLKKQHEVDGKKWILRVPDSQQGDKAQRKIYISYHSEEITEDDLRQHFEKFGEVTDVYISSPWKHFAFVTFADLKIAQSLVGKEHHLGDVSLLIKSAALTKSGKKDENGDGRFGDNVERNMPPMYPGYAPGGFGPGGFVPGGYPGMMPGYGGPTGPVGPINMMNQGGAWGGYPPSRGGSNGSHGGSGPWDKKPSGMDGYREAAAARGGYREASAARGGYNQPPPSWPGYGAYGPAMGGYRQNKKMDLQDI